MSWGSDSNANRFKKSYIQGFLDVSGGNLIVESSSQIQVMSSQYTGQAALLIKPDRFSVFTGQSSYDISYVTFAALGFLGVSYQYTTEDIYNRIKFIGSNTLTGNVTLIGSDASGASDLVVYGNISTQNNGNITGARHFFLTGDASLNQKLYVAGNASMNSNVAITLDLSVNQNVFVTGRSSFTNDVSMNRNVDIGTGNNSVAINKDISENVALDVSGSTVLRGPLSITGDTSFNRSLQIGSDLSINRFLHVSNNALFNTDVSVNQNLYVSGRASFGRPPTNTSYEVDVSGQMRIYEPSGTLASATNGSLVLQHGDASGVSSIVFRSTNDSGNDYAYIQYRENVGGNTQKGLFTIGIENDSGSGVTADRISLYAAGGSGFVGVNTLDPQSHFDVSGNTRITGTVTASLDVSLNKNVKLGTSNNSVAINKDISSNFALDVSGITNLRAPLYTLSDVSFSEKLFVTKDASFNQNLSIGQDVSINRSLYVVNRALFSNDVSINGFTKLNNSVAINKDISSSFALDVSGITNLRGPLYTLSDVSFSQKLFVTQDASFNQNLSVGQDVSINRSLYVVNRALFSSDVSINGFTKHNNSVSINKDISSSFALDVSGITNLRGPLYTLSDVSFSQKLFVAQDASFNQNLSIGQDVSINRSLYVVNRALFSNDVSLNRNVKLGTGSNSIAVNKDISSNFALDVSGTTVLRGQLSTLSDVSINGKLSVSGDISLNGNVSIGAIQTVGIGLKQPPAPMTANVTNIPGHGSYYAYTSSLSANDNIPYEVFDNSFGTVCNSGSAYNNPVGDPSINVWSGTDTISDVSAVAYPGYRYHIDLPYQINLSSFTYTTSSGRYPVQGTMLGSNNGTSWFNIFSFDLSATLNNSTTQTGILTFPNNLTSNTSFYSKYAFIVRAIGCPTFPGSRFTLRTLELFGNNNILSTQGIGTTSIGVSDNLTVGSTANFLGNVTIGNIENAYNRTGAAKLLIMEPSGTVASATSGSLVLQHGDASGVSSIVFRSTNDVGSDYAYIQYQENVGGGATQKGLLTIGVENDSGSGATADRMSLYAAGGSGFVGVNTLDPQSHFDVSGNARISGTVTASLDVSLNKNVKLGTSNNSVAINKDISSSFALDVSGITNLRAPLYALSDVSLGQKLFVSLDASFNQNLSIGQDVSINRSLYVQNRALFSNDVSINGFTKLNNSVAINKDISSSFALDVSGITNLRAPLYALSDVSLGQKLFVSLDASFNQNLSVGQDLSVNRFLYVNNNALFNKDVSTNQNLYVSGKATFGRPPTNTSYELDVSGQMRIYEAIGSNVTTSSSVASLTLEHGDASGCSSIMFTSPSTLTNGDYAYIKYQDLSGATTTTNAGLLTIGIENDSTAAATRDRISLYAAGGSGFVGVNTLDPSFNLDVSGNANVRNTLITNRIDVSNSASTMDIAVNQISGTLNIGTDPSRNGTINIGTGVNVGRAINIGTTGTGFLPAIRIGNFDICGNSIRARSDQSVAVFSSYNTTGGLRIGESMTSDTHQYSFNQSSGSVQIAGSTRNSGNIEMGCGNNNALHTMSIGTGLTNAGLLNIANGAQSTGNVNIMDGSASTGTTIIGRDNAIRIVNNTTTTVDISASGQLTLRGSSVSVVGSSLFNSDVSLNRNVKLGSGNNSIAVNKDISSSFALDVSGITNLRAPLYTLSDVSLGQKLFVSLDASFNQNLSVGQDLSINRSLYVQNRALFSSDVSINGFTKLNNSVAINKDISSSFALDVSGITNLIGPLYTLSDVSLGQKLFVSLDASFNQSLAVGQDVSINRSLYVVNRALFSSDVSLNRNVKLGSGNNSVAINKDISSSFALDVSGITNLRAPLYTLSDVSLGQNLFVSLDASFNQNLSIGQDVSINRSLYVVNRALFSSDVSLNRNVKLGSGNNSVAINKDISSNFALDVSGLTALRGDVSMNGTLFTNDFEPLSASSTLDIAGTQTSGILNIGITDRSGGIYIGNSGNTSRVISIGSNSATGGTTYISGSSVRVRDTGSADFSVGRRSTDTTADSMVVYLASGVNTTGNVNILDGAGSTGITTIGRDNAIRVVNSATTTVDISAQGLLTLRGSRVNMIGDVSVNQNLDVLGKATFGQPPSSTLYELDVSGQMRIYEAVGSNVTTNTSVATLTLEHGDASGCSSIMFTSPSTISNGDYAYIKYQDLSGATTNAGLLTIGIENDTTAAATRDRISLYAAGGSGLVGVNTLDPSFNLDVSGQIRATGNITANQLVASGLTTTTIAASAVGTAISLFTATTGNISIGGATASSNLIAIGTSASVGNVRIGGNIKLGFGRTYVGINKDITAGFLFDVSGDSMFRNKLFVNSDASFGTNVNVVGDVSVNQSLYVVKIARFGNDVSINGFTQHNNSVSINKDISSEYALDVSGITNFRGPLYTLSDVSIGQKLFVSGDVSVNQNLFIGQDVSINRSLYINNNSLFNGDVSVNQNLYVSGKATFGRPLSTNTTYELDVSGQMRIYEAVGSDVSRNTSVGTLTLQHGDASGCSSIMFTSPSTISNGDYAYIKYQDLSGATTNAGLLTIGIENDTTAVETRDRISLYAAGGSGFVGVNTLDPSFNLDVSGNVNVRRTLITNTIDVSNSASNMDIAVNQITGILNIGTGARNQSGTGQVNINNNASSSATTTIGGGTITIWGSGNLTFNTSYGSPTVNIVTATRNGGVFNLGTGDPSGATTNAFTGNATNNSLLNIATGSRTAGSDINIASNTSSAETLNIGIGAGRTGPINIGTGNTGTKTIGLGGSLTTVNVVGRSVTFASDVSLNSNTRLGTGSNSIAINKDISSNFALDVSGITNLRGPLYTLSDVSLGQKLFVSLDASFNQNLSIGQDVSINRSLYVQNRSIFSSDVSVNGFTKLNNSVAINKDISSSFALDVSGLTNLRGNLTTTNITTNGSLSIGGSLTVNGLPVSGASAGTALTTQGVQVGNDTNYFVTIDKPNFYNDPSLVIYYSFDTSFNNGTQVRNMANPGTYDLSLSTNGGGTIGMIDTAKYRVGTASLKNDTALTNTGGNITNPKISNTMSFSFWINKTTAINGVTGVDFDRIFEITNNTLFGRPTENFSVALDVSANGIIYPTVTKGTLGTTSIISTSTQIRNYTIADSSWNHVCWVINNLNSYLYLNGSIVSQNTLSEQLFRLPESTRLLWYKMENNANNDGQLASMNGTLVGSPTYSSSVYKMGAYSLQSTGASQYISIPSFTWPTTGITISAWFNRTNLSTAVDLFNFNSSSGIRVELSNGTDPNYNIYVMILGTQVVYPVSTVSLSGWVHLVISLTYTTNNTSVLKLYTNGVIYNYSNNQNPIRTYPTVASTSNRIGGVTGYTDDFRLYNTVLSDAQILEIYNEQNTTDSYDRNLMIIAGSTLQNRDFSGNIDDFRYYKDKALNQAEIFQLSNNTFYNLDICGGFLANGSSVIYEPVGSKAGPNSGSLTLLHGDASGSSSIMFKSVNDPFEYGYIQYEENSAGSTGVHYGLMTIGIENDTGVGSQADRISLFPSGGTGFVGVNTKTPQASLDVSGQLRILEGAGTSASPSTGSLVLEHTAVGGTSSIMFKGPNSTTSDYAYVQYTDASSVIQSLLKYDLSSGTVGATGNTNFTSTGTNSSALFTLPTDNSFAWIIPPSAINGITPAVCISFNQTNLNLTNTTSRINYLQTVGLSSMSSFTFSAWIRPVQILASDNSATPLAWMIANLSNGSSNGSVDIWLENNGRIYALLGDDGVNYINTTPASPLVINTWYHLVFTFDGNLRNGFLYLNGALNTAISGTALNNKALEQNSSLLLGMKWGFNTGSGTNEVYGTTNKFKGFRGQMAFVNVFDRGISASDVQYLYNNPAYNLTTIPDRGLMTIGIENESGSINNDRIVLWPGAGSGSVGVNTRTPRSTLDISGTLNVSGNVNALNYNASSDYRIKENVMPIDLTFNVDVLKPVSYVLKDDTDAKLQIGFIAHEVQEVYPFLVNGVKDGPNTQSINYNGFIGILTKEIQVLKKKVSDQEERLASQEARLQALEKMLLNK